ncbi:MAG TPA: protein-L-isoaspartate(D-aspartate) O-methyltransferase, partial [Paracoccus sp. (in: a-proteobacteria)]|nr:protein-L-isoaspartate(D-aspartate) O-methyltransferase [Paracoccus sp. (in: a-proteobacteria)]
MTDRTKERHDMVARQIAGRGVADPRVLDAMGRVPREDFVDPAQRAEAYADRPLPIGAGQTISQPYVVALMLEAAELAPGQRVLEIGAGSGYAAAVAACIVDEVWAVERIEDLATRTRHRLADLGYHNVQVHHDDGSEGWPEKGPFDAILVAASGPAVPQALMRQLVVGGRLVMPVGERHGAQRLVRVRRRGKDDFVTEDLGGVTFVPLIGTGGWADQGASARPPLAGPAGVLAAMAEPFDEIGDLFAARFDRFADRRVVLLGESSHGTAEFYRARAAITRRLVRQHGFDVIALEADWPDAAALDRRVRHRDGTAPAAPFQRFPRWMWRNLEFAALVEWLRRENAERGESQRAGIYGLDLYSLGASMEAVLDYLERVDPEAAAVARGRYGCLTPWADEPAHYGSAVLRQRYDSCEQAVVAQCRDMMQRRIEGDPDSYLDAAQNARLVSSAERYYRVMY